VDVYEKLSSKALEQFRGQLVRNIEKTTARIQAGLVSVEDGMRMIADLSRETSIIDGVLYQRGEL